MITRRRFGAVAAGTFVAALGRVTAAGPIERVRKRGACFAINPDSTWLRRVEALNAAWMYSWGPRRPDELPSEIDFVPMVWGDSTEDRLIAKLEMLSEAIGRGGIQYVLGFNEPDQKSQSNMTVERALQLWPRLMELGVPLVSPGCVHPDRDWMRAFMEEADKRDLRVDAVAVHSYGGPSAGHLMNRLEKVHREFGRPLWITEFAVGDWQAKSPDENRHSPTRVASFMGEVLPALEEASFVHRYAWFSASPGSGPLGTSALFNDQGELTELGQLYAEAP